MVRSIARCLVAACLLSACTVLAPTPPPDPTPALAPTPTTASLPRPETINLDADTQALIAHARRAVFLIPFTHWDTDWHAPFTKYAAYADGNIATAIQLAKRDPRFRYTIEQVLFAQHFWEAHPEQRADLTAAVNKRQITFAWPGITQPETSLVAPAVQMRNLQLGRDWLARVFGVHPRTAWQSDAFGNSAALPIALAQSGIPYVYMGRGRGVCEQQFRCQRALPNAFYWSSPADPAQRVLATYLFYSDAFGATAQFTDTVKQIPELRKVVDREFAQTSSRYLFMPFGADFSSPLPNLPEVVDAWNAADHDTVLVMADPETAFHYLETQPLPQFTTDLNPIWQAFYGTRPAAKIADKESEYELTAADKFGLVLDAPQSAAWYTATVNAHYDNIAGVSFDSVWEASQRPRFEQALATAADDLSRTLARIASRVPAPLVVFNPTSWPRSEVVELHGDLPDLGALPAPVQRLGPNAVAFWAEAVPSVGWRAPTSDPNRTLAHPATAIQAGPLITLTNGLVAVTLDGERGGTFASLALADEPQLLRAAGDDVTYLEDNGDVYGGFFGPERARESRVPAHIAIVAGGPLVARAQASFTLGGQPITKTVTLFADSPRVDVSLQIAALPQTTAIVQTPTTRATTVRTDDLGFAVLQHAVDDSPIVSGTITYRREVFYPTIAWGDVSADGSGLTLITHGLQGLGGAGTLNLMLVRSVADKGHEGVTDTGYHTLRYAYLPHAGTAATAQPWLAAYAFNQPLIPVWRTGDRLEVQIPFMPGMPGRFAVDRGEHPLPAALSLIGADSAIIADLYRRDDRVEAVILDLDPATPATITSGGQQRRLPASALAVVAVELNGSGESAR